jgi:hypothetical protein
MSKPKGTTNGNTPARKRLVIAGLQTGAKITDAIGAAEVSWQTHGEWMRADAKYRAAVEATRVNIAEQALDTLVNVMIGRKDDKARVQAASQVLRYAGKYAGLTPREELEHQEQDAVIKLVFDDRSREEVQGERN